MELNYETKDMSRHVIRWLKTIGKKQGWKEEVSKKHPDVSIWRNQTEDRFYQITTTDSEEYSDILMLIKDAIRTIGYSLEISEEEAYREVILEGLILDDILPYKNENYEGFTLQWSSRIGFGEYSIYRKRDDEHYIPYEADTELMEDDDKRFIKELMRQFVENLIIAG